MKSKLLKSASGIEEVHTAWNYAYHKIEEIHWSYRNEENSDYAQLHRALASILQDIQMLHLFPEYIVRDSFKSKLELVLRLTKKMKKEAEGEYRDKMVEAFSSIYDAYTTTNEYLENS